MKIKFIDLFAGTGGMRIPFDDLGFECVFSSEYDKFAKETYKANFNEIPHGDITEVNINKIPKHKLLLAGFPCQPFSNAGKKLGFDDTRGTLFFYISKIIQYHKPSIVLLENVKGFKNHDKGRTFKVVEKTLNDLNYEVFSKVLNAKDFLLPQNRERIFIVAINKSDFPKPKFNFPNPVSKKMKVGDILENIVDEKYTISDKLWDGHKRRKKEHKLKGNGFGYSLFDKNAPYTSTISARYYKDGSEILIKQNGKNPRKITPLEAKRLQGFPEDFKIVVSDAQAYRQFGNAVPVNVIRALSKEIEKLFLKK